MDRTTAAVTRRRVPEEQQGVCSNSPLEHEPPGWYSDREQLVEDSRPLAEGLPSDGEAAALTCGTLALIAIRVIDALGPIQTRSTRAIINVNLAHWARETLKRHRSDTNQRLTHLPLLKEWVKSSVEQMPMGH